MILQDLYNKVLGFFRQTDAEQQQESSKETACNRLRVVLMQDRTNLTPELMERMRKEMIELLSKYLEMDKEALELNLEQDGEQVALMLSIPVIRAKDEEEIKAALEKADEEKAEESEEGPEEESEEKSEKDDNIEENADKENSDEDSEKDLIEEGKKNESLKKPKKESSEEKLKEK